MMSVRRADAGAACKCFELLSGTHEGATNTVLVDLGAGFLDCVGALNVLDKAVGEIVCAEEPGIRCQLRALREVQGAADC